MPSAKTTLAEKLLAFAVAALYAALVGYVVVGVTRRAAEEMRVQRAQLARKKPAAPQVVAAMRRLLK